MELKGADISAANVISSNEVKLDICQCLTKNGVVRTIGEKVRFYF